MNKRNKVVALIVSHNDQVQSCANCKNCNCHKADFQELTNIFNVELNDLLFENCTKDYVIDKSKGNI